MILFYPAFFLYKTRTHYCTVPYLRLDVNPPVKFVNTSIFSLGFTTTVCFKSL